MEQRPRHLERVFAGIVFYTGERPVRLGDRVVALPTSYLWLAD